MPIGYLVTVAFVALLTVFALAPIRRPRSLALLSWGLSLVINELPFLAFYWLLAATLLAFGQGDIDSAGGWVLFGIAVLTSVGLGGIALRGWRAGPAVARAMSEGLGAGWRNELHPQLAARLRHHLPWLQILFLPILFRRHDVERLRNIPYGDAGRWNLLDLYRPRSRPPNGPTLVYLHGGGFSSGRKSREVRPLIYRLASQGWVCISANYRLRPAATFPDHLIDLKKVLAWVGEDGSDYGADTTVILAAGSSAGGNLALLAALTPNEPAFQPGFERADTSIVAAISLYGYYGPHYDRELEARLPSSPMAYDAAAAPPIFLAHGDHDTYVPVQSARLMAQRLRSRSTEPVVYAELPGGQHSFDLYHSIRFETVVDGIEAFAAWVISRPNRPPAPGPPDPLRVTF
jgi:acetyl esterase/lipase